ncbi:GmrSD restriction endonuclease domain-containing protein [Nocardia sp. NPDC004340]
MKASETTFAALVQGEKQFQIPLYQRTYSWSDKQLAQLWSDICEQAELLADGDQSTSHFCGSVVLAPSPLNDASFARWLVVDGQQRLTTLSLALAAIRDHLGESDPRQRERINEQYLINKFQEGDGFFRLLPTQADRGAYAEHIRETHAGDGGDRVGAAYRFFRQALLAVEGAADGSAVVQIEKAITTRLTLVQVVAERDDNVHRIFESLNNTGLKLSQADLLRNYLFMRLPTRGEQVYQAYWLPLQRSLSNEQLEQLMWLQLVLHGGSRTRRQDVYTAQQRHFFRTGETEADIEVYIRELHRRAQHFRRIIDPDREPDLEARRYLRRIDQWQAATTYPVLMMLLDRREAGVMSTAELVRALSYIESFLVRRMICHRPTQGLNRVFQELPEQLPEDMSMADELHQVLSAPRRYWSTDAELREAIAAKPFYWQGKPEQRRLVLQRLEESYEHPEPVDFANAKLTIEHVLPQQPGPEWLEALAAEAGDGETAEDLHERIVHTLGNLTLTGENSRLSNHPFQRKQDLLKGSHLEMNRRIAGTEHWGAAEIETRAAELAEQAIRLWPAPLASVDRGTGKRDWTLLRQAVAVIPAGTWTSYGELAALVGSSPHAVGQQLAGSFPGAYRVLDQSGRVTRSFRWPEGADRGDVHDVLRAEGIAFNGNGVAAAEQRLTAQDLAVLLGMSGSDDETGEQSGPGGERRDRFFAQLEDGNLAAAVTNVRELLAFWESIGGFLEFGGGAKSTSCFLSLARGGDAEVIWPLVVYPGNGGVGKLEVVFQYLAVREPFNETGLRNEFRSRLNELSTVDIPEGKLTLRPGIPLSAITDAADLKLTCDALLWFRDTAVGRSAGLVGVATTDGPWGSNPEYLSQPVRELLQALADRGAPKPEIDVELGTHNWPIEAVWPSRMVVLAEGDDAERDNDLQAKGYRVVKVGGVEPAALGAMLSE